jgi:hypothetical protein
MPPKKQKVEVKEAENTPTITKDTIKQTYGSERANLIIKYCIEQNVHKHNSNDIDDLVFTKRGSCYLCSKKDEYNIEYAEECCELFVCGKHRVYPTESGCSPICILCAMECSCGEYYFSKGKLQCDLCYQKKEEVYFDQFDLDRMKSYQKKFDIYLKEPEVKEPEVKAPTKKAKKSKE